MARDIEEVEKSGIWPSTPAEPSARLCNFPTGKTAKNILLPAHRAWLKDNIVPILQRGMPCVVHVEGFASRLGGSRRNDRLAQVRAEAVKKALEEEVFASLPNVIAVSHGERLSRGKPNDNDGYYRAVQVKLHLAPPTPLDRPKPEPSSNESHPYAAERFDPPWPRCGTLSLQFNGVSLLMLGGTRTHIYAADSGKPIGNSSEPEFDYSEARQKLQGVGPIPAGEYWINPVELSPKGFFRSGDAWGSFRITIHPYPTTNTGPRGGFFIHGGKSRGSAGCVDMTSNIDQFAMDLMSELLALKLSHVNCHIPLTVSY